VLALSPHQPASEAGRAAAAAAAAAASAIGQSPQPVAAAAAATAGGLLPIAGVRLPREARRGDAIRQGAPGPLGAVAATVPAAAAELEPIQGITAVEAAKCEAGTQVAAAIRAPLQSTTCYCWGWNGHGQCGMPVNSSSSSNGMVTVPTAVATLGGVELVAVAAGMAHTAVLSADGACYCFGW
jgi:hypothetical protein